MRNLEQPISQPKFSPIDIDSIDPEELQAEFLAARDRLNQARKDREEWKGLYETKYKHTPDTPEHREVLSNLRAANKRLKQAETDYKDLRDRLKKFDTI